MVPKYNHCTSFIYRIQSLQRWSQGIITAHHYTLLKHCKCSPKVQSLHIIYIPYSITEKVVPRYNYCTSLYLTQALQRWSQSTITAHHYTLFKQCKVHPKVIITVHHYTLNKLCNGVLKVQSLHIIILYSSTAKMVSKKNCCTSLYFIQALQRWSQSIHCTSLYFIQALKT